MPKKCVKEFTEAAAAVLSDRVRLKLKREPHESSLNRMMGINNGHEQYK